MNHYQQTRCVDAGSESPYAADRQVVLVLRLVLDPQARLRRGEMLDAAGASQGRFVSLTGLLATVLRWLDHQQPSGLFVAHKEPPATLPPS